MKRCLSAPPKRPQQVPPRPISLGPAGCRICRSLLADYAKDLSKCAKPTGFLNLLAHDFNVAADTPVSDLCRFHSTYKLRFDILRYIMEGVAKRQRYDALYAEVARMDVAAEKEVEWCLTSIRDLVKSRQEQTYHKVRQALTAEQKSLLDFWKAQVQDLDANISQSIDELHKRQAKDLADEYVQIEKSFDAKRPHYTTTLLEMFDQEPRLCTARAFHEARNVISKGKHEERRQKNRFTKDVERAKALRLSWTVCQQTRHLNGVVDKMQRHRRQQEASREQERVRLISRVKAALARLQRDQREELRKVHHYFVQHCFRVRHMVEQSARAQVKQRKPLYVPRHDISFAEKGDNPANFPRSTEDDFVGMVLARPECPPQPLPAEKGDQETAATNFIQGLDFPKPERPRTAQSLGRDSRQCDWCGRRSTALCVLTEESDTSASFLRGLDSYDFPMAPSVSSVTQQDMNDSPTPGPKGIPEKPTVPRKNKCGMTLSKLLDDPLQAKTLCRCCSWNCCRLWNQKYSPPYLRGRRSLQVDLLSSKGLEFV